MKVFVKESRLIAVRAMKLAMKLKTTVKAIGYQIEIRKFTK